MEDVKAVSNKPADGENTPSHHGCVSLQVTWKDLFTSLKMNHEVIRAVLPFLPFQCLSFIHYAAVRRDSVG